MRKQMFTEGHKDSITANMSAGNRYKGNHTPPSL